MASILDILGNAFKRHVQDTRTQIRVGNTLAAMGFKAKAVPTTTSAANMAASRLGQNDSIEPEKSLGEKILAAPGNIATSAVNTVKAIPSAVYAGGKAVVTPLLSRLDKVATRPGGFSPFTGNQYVEPKKPEESMASYVAKATGNFAANTGVTAWELEKLRRAPLRAMTLLPNAIGASVNELPEEVRTPASLALQAASFAGVKNKVGMALGMGVDYAKDAAFRSVTGKSAQEYIDSSNLPSMAKDGFTVLNQALPAAIGLKAGAKINSNMPAYKAAGSQLVKNPKDIAGALKTFDTKAAELKVPVSEVLGYRKVGEKLPTTKVKQVKTQPVETPGNELLTTPDEIAAAARASKKMFPKGVKDPIDVSKLKDLNMGAASFNNLYANTKKVFGDQFSKVSPLLDEFDIAKGKDAVNFVKTHQDAIQSEVVNRGIKKGSKADADIQRYGEGKITLQALQQKYPTGKRGPSWEDIVHADDFFRTSYAEILPKINAVVAQIYPGQADKLVLPRKDYYRHFQEMPKTGIGQAIQALSSPGGNIPSELTGISAFTTPKTKYASIKQKRTTDKTTYSAIGGFDNYLPQAAHAIYIDPFIPKFRALGRKLVELTGDDTPNPRKVNSYIEFLEDFSNDLAGKTNPYDRPLLKFANAMDPEKGRAILKATVAINSQVKANSVLGNIGSSLSQLANIPYGVAEAGVKNTLKGYTSALSSILTKDHPASQSAFMNERFAKTRGRFDRGVLSNAKRAAMFITGVGDEIGTRAIWSSLYEKAISLGEVDPVRYADVYTRKVVGGRGVGEMSIFMNSKSGGIVAPFQIEVANLWNNVGKDIGEKQFSKLLTYSVAAFAFNQAKKQIYGGNATLDPIDAGIDAVNTAAEEFQDGNYASGVVKGVGRMVGEAVKNAPLGQTLAAIYPQYGSDNLFGTGVKLPPRNEFLGEGDPTRYGTGFPLQQILKDPYNLLPFGGQQVKRTVQGVGDFFKGRHDDASGNKQYEVSQTLGNLVRGALLGPRYFSEAKEYNEGPKLDIFGNPEETFLSKVFNPNSKATELNNPILKEIERVGADKIDVPSASIMNSKLTKDEFIKYQSSQGEVLREFLQKAIDSPAYKAADDIKKRDMLEMVAQESENIADQVVAPPLLRKRYNVPESMSDSTMKKTFSEIRKIRGFSDLSKADQEDTFIQIFSQYPGTQK